VELLRAFEPDVIIAIGGGSAMDAGKIMWTMYEHPEEKFDDMAVDFMDIRKRVYRFKKMGEKAKFVAIPTSSGTGSEVTPFAIITDAETGIKWPITDYELMPTMSIVDTDNMMTQPKGLTSASGIDVLTHAMEAYVSIMASDYTDAIALKAAKLVFDWLPKAYSRAHERRGPRPHGQRLLPRRHGIRKRLPRPQPLDGSQAWRLSPHPARLGQRCHPHPRRPLQRS
jgi:acetaldehyde dehydrogenase/alcohol dehydrogenase